MGLMRTVAHMRAATAIARVLTVAVMTDFLGHLGCLVSHLRSCTNGRGWARKRQKSGRGVRGVPANLTDTSDTKIDVLKREPVAWCMPDRSPR